MKDIMPYLAPGVYLESGQVNNKDSELYWHLNLPVNKVISTDGTSLFRQCAPVQHVLIKKIVMNVNIGYDVSELSMQEMYVHDMDLCVYYQQPHDNTDNDFCMILYTDTGFLNGIRQILAEYFKESYTHEIIDGYAFRQTENCITFNTNRFGNCIRYVLYQNNVDMVEVQ